MLETKVEPVLNLNSSMLGAGWRDCGCYWKKRKPKRSWDSHAGALKCFLKKKFLLLIVL